MNKIKYILIFPLIILALMQPLAYSSEMQANDFVQKIDNGQLYLDKAIRKQRGGDLLRAIDYINKSLDVNPKNQYALYTKANIFFSMGDKRGALDYYNLAIKYSNKDNPNYYSSRAICYIELGEYSKALKDLKALEEIYRLKIPNFDSSFIYIDMGLIEAKANGEDADFSFGNNNLANFDIKYLSPYGYKILYKNITKGIEANPHNYHLYTTRAICAKKALMKEEKILSDINKALEINPYYYPAIMERADLYLDGGDYKEALRSYSFLSNIFKDNYYVLWKTGECYLGSEEYSKAKYYFNIALDRAKKEDYSNYDMEMFMAAIKKMVDVQTREIDFRETIARLNGIIREFNNNNKN